MVRHDKRPPMVGDVWRWRATNPKDDELFVITSVDVPGEPGQAMGLDLGTGQQFLFGLTTLQTSSFWEIFEPCER